MTLRVLYEPKHKTPGLAVVEGSFAPNGASAVDESSNEGRGFSVARTNTGEFTVTFDDVGVAVISKLATLQLDTAADSQVQVGTIDLSAKTMLLNVLTAGVAADIAADPNNRISFRVAFRNTVVT